MRTAADIHLLPCSWTDLPSNLCVETEKIKGQVSICLKRIALCLTEALKRGAFRINLTCEISII